MINHYTANRKVRNDDAYSPGARLACVPIAHAQLLPARAKRSRSSVMAGGVEASLRRLAHYDYWSDKVREGILFDSKADLVVFGMGESAIVEIAQQLQAGEPVSSCETCTRCCLRAGCLRDRAGGCTCASQLRRGAG
ncbi:MAG: hypothetical protein R3C56_39590 [Pirellulaceae bacterium]